MKTIRLALLITFSPGEDLPEGEAKVRELKRMLWSSARGKSCKDFVEDITIWHTMQGTIDEENLQDDSLDKLDRSIIHQMSVDQAKVILTSRQTVEAMLMTFSQLSSASIPGVVGAEIEPSNKKPH